VSAPSDRERIISHPDFDTRLLHYTLTTDHDLLQAIERADCLVCPSIGEGFGLPVVEGLMHELEVFASDIPVFRKNGKAPCHFFSLEDPMDLIDQLDFFFEKLPNKRHLKAKKFSWPDWK
jgi:glycosyltransferase involved in cell wall biosynthesis